MRIQYVGGKSFEVQARQDLPTSVAAIERSPEFLAAIKDLVKDSHYRAYESDGDDAVSLCENVMRAFLEKGSAAAAQDWIAEYLFERYRDGTIAAYRHEVQGT